MIAAGINATSVYFIYSDRGQVPINFIPSVGLLLFYYLYEVLRGKADKIPWLAVILGLSFHVHFTSVFYPVIIALTLPWWPNIKTNAKYYLYAVLLLIISFSPMIIDSVIKKQPFWQASGAYISSSTHGLHLRRILQLSHDAFIEFESILMFRFFRPFVFFVLPVFVYIYNIRQKRKNLWIGILLSLWIIVPWIGFSLYSGEITSYYFSIGRYIVLMIISYLLYWLWNTHILSKIFLCLFAVSFLFFNTQKFFTASKGNLIELENEFKVNNQYKNYIPYKEGDPRSYLYTIYIRQR